MKKEQLSLFAEHQNEIMISLKPEYYEMIKSGVKTYEYRKGTFIKTPAVAWIYCTIPDGHVRMTIEFDKPIYGTPQEIAALRENVDPGNYENMVNWLGNHKTACAIPIKSFKLIHEISLNSIRAEFPGFQPPQRLIYLDRKPELLQFLKKESLPKNT